MQTPRGAKSLAFKLGYARGIAGKSADNIEHWEACRQADYNAGFDQGADEYTNRENHGMLVRQSSEVP